MLSLRRIERLVSLQSGAKVLGQAVHQMRNDTGWHDAGPARKRTQVQVQEDYEGVQMKSSREQFEEWYMENWGHTEDHHETMFERDPDCPEDYYRFGVRLAHHSWQASRAAIEIAAEPMEVRE